MKKIEKPFQPKKQRPIFVCEQKNLFMDTVETLCVGRLVGLETKLGVAVASDSCKRLSAPFVTLLVRIAADGGDSVEEHAYELTLPQFQSFARQIKDIAGLMESL